MARAACLASRSVRMTARPIQIVGTRRRAWIVWVPLMLVGTLAALFVWGLLHGEDTLIRSQWIDKPVPTFTLAPAHAGLPGLATRDFGDGRARLINVFASWCIPCRVEAPQLTALRDRGVIIVGVAVRDRAEDLDRFLADAGNPYAAIGADVRSEVQIALGSSGVPETFLVDGHGVIRDQIQGAIEPAQVDPIIARLARLSR